jgi:hypothetical protein
MTSKNYISCGFKNVLNIIDLIRECKTETEYYERKLNY